MEADGVSCDPEIHSVESVWVDYRRYKANPNLGESLFYHQIMNVCLAPGDQKIKPEWFLDLAQPGWPVPKRRILAIDSADKDFQKEGLGDNMVALFGEFDEEGRLLIRHGLRSKSWTRDEFIRRIVIYCNSTGWWPTVAVKEKFGTDTWLKDLCKAFQEYYHPLWPATFTRPDKQKKRDWIMDSLQTPLERGLVVWGSQVPKPVRQRAEYECCNLGQVVHEDIADTLALFFIPKVRVEPRTHPMAGSNKWTAPHLGLYNIDGRIRSDPAPTPSPTEALASRGGTLKIGLNEDPNTGVWTPPEMPNQLQASLDAPGTGGPYTANPTVIKRR